MKTRLIQDIAAATDQWSRHYAHLAFLRTGLKMVGATKIEVKHVSV